MTTISMHFKKYLKNEIKGWNPKNKREFENGKSEMRGKFQMDWKINQSTQKITTLSTSRLKQTQKPFLVKCIFFLNKVRTDDVKKK